MEFFSLSSSASNISNSHYYHNSSPIYQLLYDKRTPNPLAWRHSIKRWRRAPDHSSLWYIFSVLVVWVHISCSTAQKSTCRYIYALHKYHVVVHIFTICRSFTTWLLLLWLIMQAPFMWFVTPWYYIDTYILTYLLFRNKRFVLNKMFQPNNPNIT